MMKKIKIFLTLAVAFLVLGFSFSVKAASQELTGYIYSENAGWISLSCSNTNSCDSINYGVLKDDTGRLSGYGYSPEGGWVNFNPNYGGVSVDSANNISGWAFTENTGWARFDSGKIVLPNNLKNNIISASDTINKGNLSSESAASLLDSLCNDFLSASECDLIVQ